MVLIESQDPLRLFCGQIRPHNKGTFGALFVSKDYRVPRILIQKAAIPEGAATLTSFWAMPRDLSTARPLMRV